MTETPSASLSWTNDAPILAKAAGVSPWGTPGLDTIVEGRIDEASMMPAAGVASTI